MGASSWRTVNGRICGARWKATWGPLADEGPVPQAEWSRPPREDVFHVTFHQAHPLDDPDGTGTIAAIAPLGFSVPVLMHGRPASGTRYRWAASQFPESGQVQETNPQALRDAQAGRR